jgi:hypothetical protein
MLPDLSSLSSMPVPFRRWLRIAVTGLLYLMMSIGLSACVASDQPPRSVLLSALGQQIQLTQTSIARSLDLDAGGVPEVSRVRLEDQDAIRIGEQKGVHLTGRFDWRLPGDAVKVDSAFELYLERGERGESWRLAIPSGSDDGASQAWITYPLAID